MQKSFNMRLLLRLFFFANLLLASAVAGAQVLGDLSFVDICADGPDAFTLVAMEDIAANRTIYFRDDEWNGTGWIDTNEGYIVWNTGAAVIPKGSIISFTNLGIASPSQPSVNFGSATAFANRGMGGGDEAIFVYTTPTDYNGTPTWICAVGKGVLSGAFGSTTGGTPNMVSGTTLTIGTTAIHFTAPLDIAAYKGPRSGFNKAGTLAQLNTLANFDTQDASGDQDADGITPDLPFSTAAFSFTAADGTPPSVTSASVTGAATVAVSFSEPVTNAGTIANYSFSPALAINSIAVDPSGNSAVITTAGLQQGRRYMLTINGLTDAAANTQTVAFSQNHLYYNNYGGTDLVITELMYNVGAQGDTLEFVEVYNKGAAPIEIGGLRIADGIDGRFTELALASAGFALIAFDSAKAGRFFNRSFMQWTVGALSNGGELITLRNFSNAILDQITYVDAAPWPTQPDGTGPSLEIIDPLTDNSVAANWRASTTNTGKTYGTPTAYSVFASPGALPLVTSATLKFAPVVQWINETKDSASIVLNLTGANPAGVSFKVDIVGAWGTATEVVDFGTLSKDTGFAAGMLGNLTIKVPVQNDALNEGDEYAVVRLSNVVGASVVDGFYHTLHIIDNDRMAPVASNAVSLSLLSSIRNMTPNSNSAEIVAYDKATKRLWIVNSIGNRINIVDMTNPAATVPFDTIDITPLGGINSIAIKDNVIVGAFENANKLLPGQVVFFDANGNVLKQIDAGVLPDMVGISPDGKYVVTANEAEPAADYLTDPEGSVTVIDISGGIAGLSQANATTISLASLNPMKAALIASGVRIFGRFGVGAPVNGGSSVAQDLEPEYVAFSPDSKKAYITVQEANALLVIDLDNKSIALDNTAQPFIKSLGFKDHSLVGNGLDASDQADSINISRWRVKGMYMPDAIATLAIPDVPGPGGKKGSTYFITANEGDAREYSALTEETPLSGLRLDPVAFPDSLVLRQPRNLGRINFTNQTGDTDGDGDMDELYVLGGRSFTIWDSLGNKVWDSGDDLEQIVKQYTRPFFNANNGTGNPSIKNRSDNKGPEPEGVTVANICDKTYAFVTLERSGGVVVYDVTDPTAPVFVTYANNRTSPSVAATADTGPEGILFIPAAESPNNQNLLLLANEISSSVSVFQVNCSPVQPVDLLRFDGRLQAGDAVLQWQIASADDLKYFELQHSTDARNFKPVGTLQPAGTNYQFVHTNLPDGKHYYRLQTAEKDGQKKLSRTVVLVKGAGNSFVIGLQQNPVRNGFVTPNLYSAKAQLANAIITDVAGRNVGSTKMQLKKGQQQWQIAAPAAAGIYFLTITTEDGLRETIRFVK